jgi:hypothetical protein
LQGGAAVKQHEAVIQAMRENGGYATLGHLYRTATRVHGSQWGTKTPFASIRRIVQEHKAFFKITPGLWALASERDAVLAKLALDPKSASRPSEEFNHTYYQGLLVQIGNLKDYETFVPPQDKNRPFLGRRLSEVVTLKEFYGFTYDSLLRRAKTVDVSWFNDRKFPKAFFEVEHSTDMRNSLLKFKEFEDFRINYYIVADTPREREFQSKISSPAFSSIREAVKFLSYEKLAEWHTQVFRTTPIERELGL